MRALLLGLLLALPVGASAQTVVLGDSTDAAAILAQSRAFSAAFVAGDIVAMVAIYTADGIAAPSGYDFLRGPDALTAFWTRPEDAVISHHQAVPEALRIDGDLASDWGYYEGTAGPVGEATAFRGKYLIVSERGADGVWHIAQDMWNALPGD